MSEQVSEPAWRVLLGYVRPFRIPLFVGAVLSLATAAVGLALPLVVRQLIGGIGSGRTVIGLLVLMSVLVLANAGSARSARICWNEPPSRWCSSRGSGWCPGCCGCASRFSTTWSRGT